MERILRIQKKVLEEILNLRKKDDNLFFMPRKINNSKRLENGYWFIGNDQYLQVSFWKGMDWKEKIHNISFVVLSDGQSYIELSAQDSKSKTKFFERMIAEIKGFKKYDKKDKWIKRYKGKDYIENLNSFIKVIKPQIDQLLISEQPQGISLLSLEIFNKYYNKIDRIRKNHIRAGKVNKVSKICWNTENWKFPSGSKGKSSNSDSHESDSGYGQEEWLFDKSRIIENYHYAFLQPLNLITERHEGQIFNISLFTINNKKKKYYVGEVRNAECITKEESIRIYNIYKEQGWLEQMRQDVERVGANGEKFDETKPEIFFNIRFEFRNVFRPDDLLEISNEDLNITTNRYKLLPRSTEILIATENEIDDFEGNRKNTKKRKRVFDSESEYEPYHDMMQNAIYELLKKSSSFGYKKVYIERGRVDIKAVTQNDTLHFYELKTDSPKLSIRKAIGQIMEYAYFPSSIRAEKLIIVADEVPTDDIVNYLKHIREKFNLPLYYRCFDLKTNELSEEY